MDSTLMTSAPNAASEWVAAGPAQNAVRSMIRTPANGSLGAEPPALRTSGSSLAGAMNSVGSQPVSLSPSPRAGALRIGAGRAADISQGVRGWWKPQGFATNTP